jgi:hypothetical protein
VCEQERLAITQLEDETLVPRSVVVIRQQAQDEARIFYPAARVGFRIR